MKIKCWYLIELAQISSQAGQDSLETRRPNDANIFRRDSVRKNQEMQKLLMYLLMANILK